MKRFEYKHISGGEYEDINIFGKQRWELVSVVQYYNGGDLYYYYFKRELTNNND